VLTKQRFEKSWGNKYAFFGLLNASLAPPKPRDTGKSQERNK